MNNIVYFNNQLLKKRAANRIIPGFGPLSQEQPARSGYETVISKP